MKPQPSGRSFNCHRLRTLLISRGLRDLLHPPVQFFRARKQHCLSCGIKRANYIKDKLSSATHLLLAIYDHHRGINKENLTLEMFHVAVLTNWSHIQNGSRRQSNLLHTVDTITAPVFHVFDDLMIITKLFDELCLNFENYFYKIFFIRKRMINRQWDKFR